MNAKKFNFDLADSETMQLLKHYTLYLPFLQRKQHGLNTFASNSFSKITSHFFSIMKVAKTNSLWQSRFNGKAAVQPVLENDVKTNTY